VSRARARDNDASCIGSTARRVVRRRHHTTTTIVLSSLPSFALFCIGPRERDKLLFALGASTSTQQRATIPTEERDLVALQRATEATPDRGHQISQQPGTIHFASSNALLTACFAFAAVARTSQLRTVLHVNQNVDVRKWALQATTYRTSSSYFDFYARLP
jgi:hypothetical protein